MQTATVQPKPKVNLDQQTTYRVLFAISFVHLLNDSIQSVIPAIFPILQESMNLTYFQLGMIGFALNMTASIMQPFVGFYTDKRPSPFLLPMGMFFTFLGMLGLAFASNFYFVLLSVVLVGVGSAVFHPEGSRVVYLAAGQRRGLAQSIFQVGGNAGQALAPIMTVLIFVPLGQFGAIWFTFVAAMASIVLLFVARWAKERMHVFAPPKKSQAVRKVNPEKIKAVRIAMGLLLFFIFARSWYHASITNYYPFYLMQEYGLLVEEAQIYIFIFLAAGAVGTFMGGPLADRFGKKKIILFSMLGSAPLTLILPYVSQEWAYAIFLINGFIILSSFSVTVVYAQELVPGKIGTVTGLTIGLAFGMGALGSLALGGLVDIFSLTPVMIAAGFLPLIGVVAYFLPSDQKLREWAEEA
ncbi:MFS transporter [Bacillus horti]|uniref:FSR family fosmidomycin resistance protein-like MFS transporter n=1 Tax=Caldalkalibacillus horti TaxID=77523 RepID=A0ABT9W2P4_9BACI|nr:MFS transporter [Bacillus horti]MDQ0167506.1 FSR family fosmidomycin resistance protein-like MFS transporter [Bacillus horti]